MRLNSPLSHDASAHSGPAHIADILADLRTDQLDLLADLAAEQEALMRQEWDADPSPTPSKLTCS